MLQDRTEEQDLQDQQDLPVLRDRQARAETLVQRAVLDQQERRDQMDSQDLLAHLEILETLALWAWSVHLELLDRLDPRATPVLQDRTVLQVPPEALVKSEILELLERLDLRVMQVLTECLEQSDCRERPDQLVRRVLSAVPGQTEIPDLQDHREIAVQTAVQARLEQQVEQVQVDPRVLWDNQDPKG